MKSIVIAAALAALASTSAFAQQTYIGASVGAAKVDVDCSGTLSCDDKDTAYKIFAGYKFMPNLAGELTYVNFGKVEATFDDGDGGIGNVEAKGSGIGLGIAYFANFSEQWVGVARLGVLSGKVKISETGFGSDSETKARAYGGLGISYMINKNLSVDGTLDFTSLKFDDDSNNVTAVSVGLTYGF